MDVSHTIPYSPSYPRLQSFLMSMLAGLAGAKLPNLSSGPCPLIVEEMQQVTLQVPKH